MECRGNKQLLQTYTLNIGDTDTLLQSEAAHGMLWKQTVATDLHIEYWRYRHVAAE